MPQKVAPGKYVEIAYDLYSVAPDDTETLEYQIPATNPEQFVFGVTPNAIPALLEAIEEKQAGDSFTVTVAPQEGFGEYNDDLVRIENLPKEIFEVDGKIDTEKIRPQAHVYLQTNTGQYVPATIIQIDEKTVCTAIDFNHRLAGKTVTFKGEIITVRDATDEEIAAHMQQGQCCGGCCGGGNCGGDGGCECGNKGCNCDK